VATRPAEYDGGPSQDVVLERSRSIIQRISTTADEQVRKKKSIEARWIENLRQYWGKYDPDTETKLKNAEKSRAFVKLTRHKTNGWSARLFDLLFPTDDENWGIQPTPVPKLAMAAKKALEAIQESLDGANQADAAGNAGATQVLADQANAYAQAHKQTEAEIKSAKERCEAMQKVILDQLTESSYPSQARDVIEDGCRLGTGILKGPLTSNRLRREWREEPIGHWSLVTLPDPMPEFRRVDPWHFFPDMSAGRIGEAEFTLERHLPTKKDLRRLALKLGFSKPAVSRLLEQGPQKSQPENVDHLAVLREMIGEGEAIIDRYLMWEYHGALECEEVAILLRAMDRHEEAREYELNKDEFEEYRVILYFCDNELLKIEPDYPLDSGETLYSVWNFEKGETSIFGIGVPEIMADSQSAINGAWRMMLDNAALSVGPQIVIDKQQITPQLRNDYKLKPLKVWLRSSTSVQAANPPFEVFNIPNNQQQLAGIVEMGKQLVDEETSMPMMAQGEQGSAPQTLGGTSILMNSANVVFRRVVKSWDDDLTTPTLRRAYDWNMQFNPDEEIKGDMQVDARGTSVLLVREIQSQNLLMLVTNWSVHQVLGPWIKVRASMEKALQTMMVPPDDVLFTQEEYDDNAEKAAAAAAKNPPQDPNAIKLQIVQATNESREKVATLTSDARLKEAEIKFDTVMAQLEAETGLSREELQAKYGLEKEKIASSERTKAVDVAVEERRAAEAKSEGQLETEATGTGVG
jgi:hypothetical protein